MRLVNWSQLSAGLTACGARHGIILVAIRLVVRPNLGSTSIVLYSSVEDINNGVV